MVFLRSSKPGTRDSAHHDEPVPDPGDGRGFRCCCGALSEGRDRRGGAARLAWLPAAAIHVRHAQSARRSEEHTSELQSLMRISYAVFCLKKKTNTKILHNENASI